MSAVEIHLVNLYGGGADTVCTDCIPEARVDRAGQIVSTAKVDAPGEPCVYCFRVQGEEVRR